MNTQDMPVHHGKIKPGESLCTAEWWDLTRRLTPEQRGFAQMVLLFMHRHGWQDIPDDRTLADGLRLHIRVVRRLLPSLTAIPAHTIHQQLLRIGRWPEAIIEELSA